MTAPKLFRILLEVGDIERASAFYAELLGDPGRRVQGGRHYFDCGGTIVGLVNVTPANRVPQPAPQHVYFAVADLDGFFQRAKTLDALSSEKVHGEAAGKIVERPWGERSFYAVDPFGNPLCFVDEKTLFTGR
ncbi:MAG TPA: VOC family protein [Candidatus Eisenbacteria bacterium]|nr:VOC family protein [Candidatus Eisenbacteria bacterium]